jgi:hypothetical protein
MRIRIQESLINVDPGPEELNQCGSGSTRAKRIRIQESLINVDPDPGELNQYRFGSETQVSHLSPASLATTSVLPSRLTAMQAELLPTCTPKAVLPIAK